MVYIFLAQGFEEIEALATVDILRRAEIDVKMVSIEGIFEVKGAHGIKVFADIMFDEMKDEPEMLILPGGMPGTINLGKFEPLCDMLKKAKCPIAAICAAPSVFGELGLLKGKKATCYPGFEDKLYGAEISDLPVVVNDNVITSRGAGTAHLFGFALVSILRNGELAENLKKSMMY